MQGGLRISPLLLAASGLSTAYYGASSGLAQMARLANRFASDKLGLAPSQAPGGYLPVYSMKERFVEEAVFEERDIVWTEDISETRPVIETRVIYETRPILEERAILETKIEGGRRLTRYDSIRDARIDTGADFSITVGDNAAAVVTFESATRISLTVGDVTQEFTFQSTDGSFRDGLLAALNSIDGLSAEFPSSGKLRLETVGGQSLVIADVANEWWDWSDSPLAKLGLSAGLTGAQVTGYEQVQTGSEQVEVGSEQVTVGVETVKIGERTVVTGRERVMTGTVLKVGGYDYTLVGLEEPEEYGAGVLGLFADNAMGGLPANYVEALFGGIPAEERGTGAPGFESYARAAYAEIMDAGDEQDRTPDAPERAPVSPSAG